MKKRDFKIVIKDKPVAKGHQAHRSGAGHHEDRRTKRLRTRRDRNRAAIREF